ncbi:MAG TPA: copper chaperone PCu(A)C [Thermoanaerobaculia bacterium]|nr:copper chaperone PCu(A)C [Thermoanaerobaculia bacterium]
MKRSSRLSLLLVAVLIACSQNDFTAEERERGRELYMAYGCAACHGRSGDGSGPAAASGAIRPRDFASATSFRQGQSVDSIATSIATGVQGGVTGMPPYPSIPESERRLIAAWIASLGRKAGGVVISDAWVRQPNPAMKMGSAFFTIENRTPVPVSLVAVSTPAAKTVEIHESAVVNGVMSMRRVPGIPIPPHRSAKLEPGGLHLMLIGLAQPLDPGSRIDLVLQFDDGGAALVHAVVREDPGMKKAAGA